MKCDRRWYNDGRVRLEAGLSPFHSFPHIKLSLDEPDPDPLLSRIGHEIDVGMYVVHYQLNQRFFSDVRSPVDGCEGFDANGSPAL